MALVDVGFEWEICDGGYKLIDPKPRPQGGKTILHEAGQRIEASPRIKAATKAMRLHRPLEFHKSLYLDFSKLDASADSCIGFASRFGLLGLRSKGGEPLVLWQDEIAAMKRLIDLASTRREALADLRISPLHGALKPSPPDGRLVFQVAPSSLLHGMKLQFAMAITSGHDIKVCRYCGNWFEAGGSERRRDAQYCSEQHKIDQHNLEKRRKSK